MTIKTDKEVRHLMEKILKEWIFSHEVDAKYVKANDLVRRTKDIVKQSEGLR